MNIKQQEEEAMVNSDAVWNTILELRRKNNFWFFIMPRPTILKTRALTGAFWRHLKWLFGNCRETITP